MEAAFQFGLELNQRLPMCRRNCDLTMFQKKHSPNQRRTKKRAQVCVIEVRNKPGTPAAVQFLVQLRAKRFSRICGLL
jgi:hypothetical protein